MKEQLEAEMQKAAAAHDFEKAAQLRDMLLDLRRTTQKTEKFARVPYKLPVALDPESDLAELGKVLKLPAPPARIEGFDISNISDTFAVASMVSFKNARPDRSKGGTWGGAFKGVRTRSVRTPLKARTGERAAPARR